MLVKVILTVQTGSEEQTVVTALCSQSFRHQEIRKGCFLPNLQPMQHRSHASVELLLH